MFDQRWMRISSRAHHSPLSPYVCGWFRRSRRQNDWRVSVWSTCICRDCIRRISGVERWQTSDGLAMIKRRFCSRSTDLCIPHTHKGNFDYTRASDCLQDWTATGYEWAHYNDWLWAFALPLWAIIVAQFWGFAILLKSIACTTLPTYLRDCSLGLIWPG